MVGVLEVVHRGSKWSKKSAGVIVCMRFKSQLCHLQAVWPWTGFWASLSLSFIF